MNIKLHTPKTLKSGSGLTSAKQFFLSIIATSISIALTFGTAAFLDNRKKEAAKKEMVMMVISDFDKTIDIVEKVDTGLRECRRLQRDIALHPEDFDSLRVQLASGMAWILDEFPETTEKIFTSSIETFSTIGNVNFVNDVSSFYITRRKYKEMVMDELKEQCMGNNALLSLKTLLDTNIPEYVLLNWSFLESMKDGRDRCMQMMKVSEEDLAEFSKRQAGKVIKLEKEEHVSKMSEEYMEYYKVLEEAKEKLKE